ncbi:MAG: hypothetical protein WBB82_14915 [Limnothrix sp.]
MGFVQSCEVVETGGDIGMAIAATIPASSQIPDFFYCVATEFNV